MNLGMETLRFLAKCFIGIIGMLLFERTDAEGVGGLMAFFNGLAWLGSQARPASSEHVVRN